MRLFTQLFEKLDRTNSTLQKVEALTEYFSAAPAEDAAWGLFYLSGRKSKRLVNSTLLSQAAQEVTGLSPWLVEESYSAVGDLGETIACLVGGSTHPTGDTLSLRDWMETRVLSLRGLSPDEQKALVKSWWKDLSETEIFLVTKLMTGGFRAGVSHLLVVRALAKVAGVDEKIIAERLMGEWHPTPAFYKDLVSPESQTRSPGAPYPFFLASPLEDTVESLGPIDSFCLEWKWDGIRAQGIRREGKTFLWSRGEELITERFPEIEQALDKLPDGSIIDGEILAFNNERVMPFGELQKRIGRKTVSANILKSVPVIFMGFDCLEDEGVDLREHPLHERRKRLEKLLAGVSPALRVSKLMSLATWDLAAVEREKSRDEAVEGLMLKRWESPYRIGRRRGDWWKWKIAPLTVDAVLLYAQPGHGRRATLYTDYTFAVWKEKALVPIAKAYSGLTDDEIIELDRWIRRNTVEKFGPVRSLKPARVFELAFENVAKSTRHKAGIAVRFPRILRERTDKTVEQANTIEDLARLVVNG